MIELENENPQRFLVLKDGIFLVSEILCIVRSRSVKNKLYVYLKSSQLPFELDGSSYSDLRDMGVELANLLKGLK